MANYKINDVKYVMPWEIKVTTTHNKAGSWSIWGIPQQEVQSPVQALDQWEALIYCTKILTTNKLSDQNGGWGVDQNPCFHT